MLLVPLADPPQPATSSANGFAVKVALWYAASIILLASGVHVLARSLEDEALSPAGQAGARGSRRW